MGGLEAVDLVPSIFLDQTEDNSAKKILFWIALLHTLRSRSEVERIVSHDAFFQKHHAISQS